MLHFFMNLLYYFKILLKFQLFNLLYRENEMVDMFRAEGQPAF